jgi:hypothetical protein
MGGGCPDARGRGASVWVGLPLSFPPSHPQKKNTDRRGRASGLDEKGGWFVNSKGPLHVVRDHEGSCSFLCMSLEREWVGLRSASLSTLSDVNTKTEAGDVSNKGPVLIRGCVVLVLGSSGLWGF